ncbi:MAG: TATA-box-binding protein [Candidatus Thermoplasmatota archaeon]|nr:TATA-box-binding protein [Candidatus Thermoplasmatota archaeon]
MADVTIENIVASAQLADKLDIRQIADAIPESKYNPDNFPGLILHFEEPKSAILLFSSGKFICTGTKRMEDVSITLQKLVSKMHVIGINVEKQPEMKVQNIVISADLGKEFQLTVIAKGLLQQNVEYEPEQFPGLIYRMDDAGTVILLFSSGKLVCTGAKAIEEAAAAVNLMKEKLASLGVL